MYFFLNVSRHLLVGKSVNIIFMVYKEIAKIGNRYECLLF